MKVGDEQYKRLLRRLTQIEWMAYPTREDKAEADRINAQLTAAELQGKGLRDLVDDYDLMANAGDLGGVELV